VGGAGHSAGHAANVTAVSTREETDSTAPGWDIRPAAGTDWPAIWGILEPVIRAGETFTWDLDTTEHQARERWFKQPPGQTFVAVVRGELDGVVLGTGELHANQGGGGSHVANAGYMVHPAHGGKGVARGLCAYSLDAARAAGFRAMQFNAVVESNVRAVAAWQSLGFEVLATIPEAFLHPRLGYVGLHLMYRRL
jgi:L-amino acid N-acyltransferase YncA